MESVLFEDGARGVKITTAMAQIAGTTYPISGITSVRTLHRPPSMLLPGLVGTVGACALIVAFLMAVFVYQLGGANQSPTASGMAVLSAIVGLGALGLVSQMSRGARVAHIVVIGTAGGDKRALSTVDTQFSTNVQNAIEEAIRRRG